MFRESVVVECVFFRACGLINDVSDAVVAWFASLHDDSAVKVWFLNWQFSVTFNCRDN